MEQNKEWTNVMRDAFRDAEAMPPADGWARLERELGSIPAPRVPVWRVYRTRIAAAAALVACVATGGYLWYATPDPASFDENVIASAVGSGQTVTEPVGELTAESALLVEAPVVLADASVSKPGLKARVARSETPAAFGRRAEYAAVPQAQVQVADATDVTSEQPVEAGAQAARRPQSRAATGSAAKVSADDQARALRGEGFVAQARPRKKTSFALNAGGAVTGASTATGSVGLLLADASNALPEGDLSMRPLNRYEYPESSFRHHQPLSFGLSVRKEFAYGLSLESGVNYTLLRSDVDLEHGTESVSQKLHFIGIPLRLNWQFLERGRFSLYIGAGGMVEKCVSAKFGSKRVDEPGVQWSVLGAAGAQYRLGGVVGLYFEPEASYYFTDTSLRTSRTDSPLTLTLRLGVRLSF